MNNYEQPLIDAGMKSVDVYELVSQIRGYMKEGRILVIEKIIDAAFERFGLNPEVYAALVDLRLDTREDRRSAVAQTLLDAVQDLDIRRLKVGIDQAKKLMEQEVAISRQQKCGKDLLSSNLVDAELPGNMGFTALHVACANYKMHTNCQILLNEIIGVLLEAGANPWKPMGEKWQKKMIMGRRLMVLVDPGRTISEVCGRDLAPKFLEFTSKRDEEPVARPISYSKNLKIAA